MTDTGWTLDNYEVLAQVAVSATGAVWRGYDHALGRAVAIKQVARAAFTSVERLRAEARLLAALPHPNIVGVIDLIESGEQVWLVEEWIDGAALPDVVTGASRFTPVQAVGTVRGALLGLAHAHTNGVVHGDFAPGNVLLDRDGVTRLIDFGLAQPAGAIGFSGTPGYLSPEAAGGRPLAPASDVYSAAAVLTLLLRGQPAFAGPTPQAVLAAQFGGGRPDLGGVPAPLGAVLAAALSPAPQDRPADAVQFLGALDEAAEHTFGAGWWAGAGVAGLVSATLAAQAGGGATPVVAGAPSTVSGPARPLGHRTTGPSRLRHVLHSPRALTGIGVGAVAAGAAVVIAVTQLGGSPAKHAAAPPTVVATPVAATSRTTAVQPASFDLHGVNWKNVTIPGKACFSRTGITLHNGTAKWPLPAASSIAGLPPGGYQLGEVGAVRYGRLAGGPDVAALTLLCAGTGSNSGTGTFWWSIAVFDGAGGRPHGLGVFTTNDLGTVPGTQSGLVGLHPAVSGGVVTVAGSYWHGADAHCCPSGRASTTVAYRNGRLVATRQFVIGAGASTTPTAPASAAPSAPGRIGRTITAMAHSGGQYVATVRAEDTAQNCAANSYGAAMIAFFRAHPCPTGIGRRLVTIPYHGRTVAMSVIVVTMPPSRSGDPYQEASELSRLENAPGTGGLNDLLRSGVRPAGWPARIPAHEVFVVAGEDATIAVFDLWYLDGSTADQDPALVALARDLFLTPITIGPF